MQILDPQILQRMLTPEDLSGVRRTIEDGGWGGMPVPGDESWESPLDEGGPDDRLAALAIHYYTVRHPDAEVTLIAIAVGALVYGIETSWHKQEDLTGPYVQVQTCKKGLGGYVKGNHEWVAGGVQFAPSWQLSNGVSISVPIQGGGSYSNTINPKNGIRQITKFHFGGGVTVSYDRYSILMEYNHLSNGKGIDPTNEGQDNLGVMAGYSFP